MNENHRWGGGVEFRNKCSNSAISQLWKIFENSHQYRDLLPSIVKIIHEKQLQIMGDVGKCLYHNRMLITQGVHKFWHLCYFRSIF
jgi:hypothetical protein